MAELCRKYTDTISYRVFSYEVYKQEFFEKYMRSRQIEEWTGLGREKDMYQVYIQPKVSAKQMKSSVEKHCFVCLMKMETWCQFRNFCEF